MYDDAYTLQMVEKQDVGNFNFVAGMVPFLFNLIQDVRKCYKRHSASPSEILLDKKIGFFFSHETSRKEA